MKTAIHIMRPGDETEVREIDLTGYPDDDAMWRDLSLALRKLIGTPYYEHVTVLHPTLNRRADMFVDEMGLSKNFPINDEATRIYRANWLKQHPNTDPETLPHIAGIAILFDDIVWR